MLYLILGHSQFSLPTFAYDDKNRKHSDRIVNIELMIASSVNGER